MSLRIFSTTQSPTQQFIDILTHYFKQETTKAQQKNQLFINTKYYTCKVPLIIHQGLAYQKQENPQKTDMILILINEQEHIEEIGKKINSIITQFNPQSSMICVHVSNVHGEREWHHQSEINECENFIPIIYENILKVKQVLPSWSSQGLLIQNGDQYQIFTIFDLIQTTTWSNLIKRQPQSKKNKQGEKACISKQQNTTQTSMKQENAIKQSNKQQEQQTKKVEGHQQYQQNEQQMQKQMAEFEMLMQQMMEVRAMPATANQRKLRAEDLIMRLAKTIGEQ